MKNYILSILLLVFTYACTSKVKPRTKIIAQVQNNSFITEKPAWVLDETSPYDIEIILNEKGKNMANLIVKMKLNNGAFFVSPNAKRDFKGKFKIEIEKTDFLTENSKIIESPLSKEINDPHPFVNGKVNWVRKNTTYTQELIKNSNKDFIIKGFVQFTIEPRCTLEKIPFTIYNKDGKMYLIPNGC